ncbi:MAG TPA: ABC transporter ATP-binding protein [Defluviitaleaceae bacterium]|nr:ABC transporter ATP-binding protein [Defluviitaleaceae bacterium]HPT76372.1 ABC transporter ATP-binding protein [Defluviitaleaceae bacterium]
MTYLKPYRRTAILAPLLMFIEVIMDLLQPTLLSRIVDNGINAGNIDYIIKTGIIMISVAFIGGLGGFGCIISSTITSQNFATDLRSDLFKKIQSFSFSNLDKFKTGSLITRLTNDVTQVQNIVLMSLRIMVRAPLLFIGGIIMAMSINLKLTLILIISIPILIISVSLIIKKGFPLFTLVQEKIDRVNTVMRENLAGIRVVKAFVREEKEKARFHNANLELTETMINASKLISSTMPVMMLIMNLSIVAVLWFGGLQINAGAMKEGQLIAFINYLTQILFSLLMIAFILMMVSRAKISAERIIEVLETEVDIKDAETARDIEITRGEVIFENVSFQYTGAKGDAVLKNISFKAESGQTVAILGGTGSGKTTLVSLIPRLYDVSSGRILIDHQDIRNYKLNALRKGIGVVLQKSVLFSGTIRDNLKWGNKNVSDEKMIAACKAACAHDFIMSFPEQYDTLLGQGGVNLSGGQKQRLSIARALIKEPKILILDDSTSAVDMETESKIQKALKEMKGTTIFIIAQRISSVMNADKIIVLEDGEIVAEGRHEELLKTSPIYQDIYHSQIREGESLND